MREREREREREGERERTQRLLPYFLTGRHCRHCRLERRMQRVAAGTENDGGDSKDGDDDVDDIIAAPPSALRCNRKRSDGDSAGTAAVVVAAVQWHCPATKHLNNHHHPPTNQPTAPSF